LITVPNGITFDADGNVYCINTYDRNINRITPGGVVSTYATLPSGSGGFLGGSMVSVSGKIYVTSPDRNLIYQVSEGNVAVFAGSGTAGNADGQGTAATFNRPLGLTTNAAKTKLFSTTYEQANAALRVTEL
jgi:DNA-binding beta-propeller fold protein YncE